MIKIGLKYCGNCNPHINSPEIIRTLHNLLPPGYLIIPWAEGDYRVLLVLSGCPVDCAERPRFTGPQISVTGRYVDLQETAEKNIPEALLSRILHCVG